MSVGLVRGLEIGFENLGYSAVHGLPCRCWCGLSTQTFGEELSSLYFPDQVKCVERLVTGVVLVAVVEAG